MGSQLSTLKPRPVRPPRPSQADLPSLPSLPIYQTISSYQAHCFEGEDEPKPLIPPKSPSRKSSVSVSVKDWPLRRVQDEAPAVPAIPPSSLPHRSPSIGRSNRHAASCQEFPPPRYDRASHLAESYRSLLPKIDPDTSWTIDWDEPLSKSQRYTQRESSCEDDGPNYPYPTDYTRSVTPAPAPVPAPVRSATLSPSSARPPPLRTSRQRISKIPSSPDLRRAPVPPFCDVVSPTVPSLTHQTRQVTSALSTLPGSTALALSAELLTHELAHALNIPDATQPSPGGAGGTSKLQMLLLIEAYEAVLETCQRELGNIAALEAGGESEIGETSAMRLWEVQEEETRRRRRQWHIQEAIGILGHWLGVLYRIYDGIYEEPWEGGDGLGMI